jgi:hypothetical protein
MFEEITALHQQVREYVEGLEPEYKVMQIEGDSTTKYKTSLASEGEYVHAFTDIDFKVQAVSSPGIRQILEIRIYVVNDKLVEGDRVMSTFF